MRPVAHRPALWAAARGATIGARAQARSRRLFLRAAPGGGRELRPPAQCQGRPDSCLAGARRHSAGAGGVVVCGPGGAAGGRPQAPFGAGGRSRARAGAGGLQLGAARQGPGDLRGSPAPGSRLWGQAPAGPSGGAGQARELGEWRWPAGRPAVGPAGVAEGSRARDRPAGAPGGAGGRKGRPGSLGGRRPACYAPAPSSPVGALPAGPRKRPGLAGERGPRSGLASLAGPRTPLRKCPR